MVKKWSSWKSKSAKPYIEELTVFIRVSIANLNELSKLEPEIDNKEVKSNKEIINITNDKKYLLTSSFLKLIFK